MGNGDCDALRLLYAASAPEIYAFALSCLRHPQDAEDVLHDCLLRAWENAGSYRSQGKPLAWLLTIARNLCMDRLRKQRRFTDLMGWFNQYVARQANEVYLMVAGLKVKVK